MIPASLPYSGEALAAFIESYNARVWPAHAVSIVMIFGVVASLLKHKPASRHLVFIVSGLFYLWVGAVFYINGFSSLNFLAPYVGGTFIVQGSICLVLAAAGQKINNSSPSHRPSHSHSYIPALSGGRALRVGLAFIILAVIVYPALMAVIKGGLSGWRMPGMTPVSTSLFTIGAVAPVTDGKQRLILLVLPVLHLLFAAICGIILFF